MSIGTITTPPEWLNATIATPQWFQTVQDDVNYLIADRSIWLGPNHAVVEGFAGSPPHWQIAGGIDGVATTLYAWRAATTTYECVFPAIPLSYSSNSTKMLLSSVTAKIYKTSTATTTMTVRLISGLSGTTLPGSAGVANVNTTTAGLQTISISSSLSTAFPSSDQWVGVGLTAGAVGDAVFGLLLNYTKG